jgi:hypothetical protein
MDGVVGVRFGAPKAGALPMPRCASTCFNVRLAESRRDCPVGEYVRTGRLENSYQRKRFDTADFWENGPRVFYTLRPPNTEPFDTQRRIYSLGH